MRYAKYTVAQGDTLQFIAQHIMGDASKWVEIAKYNKLKHPYITDDPSDKLTNPNVVCYGDVIIVPKQVLATELSDKPLSANTKKVIEELYYGRDISMTLSVPNDDSYEATDGVLEMGEDQNRNHIIVAGIANLRQACLTRLMTVKGTLPLHPEYGSELRMYQGSKITKELLTLIELETQTTLLKDQRVQSVVCDATRTALKEIYLDIKIKPTDFDEIVELVLSLDSRTGGEFALVN